MLVVEDALDAFYLGAFLFGIFFSAVSCVGGTAHVGLHGSGAHGATGFHASHPAPIHLPVKAAAVKLLNVPSLVAFVSWFGGVGYPARNALGLVTPLSLLCGVAGGVLAATAVAWFFARVVAPNDTALDAADFALPGLIARVSSPIRAGGTGEIVYELGGVRQVSAARADAAEALPRGASVRIARTDRGIAYVGATLGPPP